MRGPRIHLIVAALACGALAAGLVACGGDDDTDTVTVTQTTAGNDFETALREKLEGVEFDCGDEELPPADGKTITCEASDDEGAKGELKLARKGDSVTYSLQLRKPDGGVRIKTGVLGADGGGVNLTPGTSGGGSGGGSSGTGGVPGGGY
jgi:uncharacterized membrane protein YgcG